MIEVNTIPLRPLLVLLPKKDCSTIKCRVDIYKSVLNTPTIDLKASLVCVSLLRKRVASMNFHVVRHLAVDHHWKDVRADV